MKRLLVLLLIVAMVITVSGCSSIINRTKDRAMDEIAGRIDDVADQNGDTVDKPVDTEDGEALVEGDFYAVESIFDFSRYFKEVEYTFVEGTQENVFSYIFLGEDTVNGVKATGMLITADGQDMEIWANPDNEIVRAVIDDQVFEGDDAEMMGFMLIGYMMPFMIMMGWEDAFTDLETMEYYGWRVVDQGTISRNLGAGNVRVSTFEIQIHGVDGTFTYEIADIQGRNFFIGWKIVDNGRTTEYKVTKLIPR